MSLTFREQCRVLLTTLVIGMAAQCSALATAAPADDLGPAVGSAAPDIGTPLDQTGKPRALTELMGDKGIVLLFFRSAEWCPYCQAQLMDINGGAANIAKLGFNLVALSYDKPEPLAAFTARRGIKFTLLSDPKSEIIDRYKLRDPAYPPGSKAYGVPRPIIFIIDRAGIIRAKLYEETYLTRPPVSKVIETIDGLSR